MVSAKTQNIRVKVQTQYQQDFSSPADSMYFFSYHILITNMGAESVQLLSRHWYILDSLGAEREIEGPGVVGEQPTIEPGRSHNYTSSCRLNTEIGQMWGYYIFKRLSDDTRFQVEIPCFQLETPVVLN